MIKCNTCGIEKCDNDFAWQNKSKGKRQRHCKQCHKEYVAEHYKRNKESYVARARKSSDKYYQRNKKWLDEYRADLKCTVCGESHPAVLDFHHTDPTEKEFTVAGFGTKSIERIKKEIHKCIVLCANCHRKLHWNMKAQMTE